jgi:peptide/nickel transport system ATP-binding protein
VARCIAGLHAELTGEMSLGGEPLAAGSRKRPPELRRAVQYIFQNPYASLNPRRQAGQSIGDALLAFERPSRRQLADRVAEVLEQVAMHPSVEERYPHQLSGGQRQRVAIARALIVDPKVLVCDEVTSSLDVSVQAVIVELLDTLRRTRGLTLLFVTHNLALVQSVAQEVAVMDAGRIVEHGHVTDILEHPTSATTRALLSDVPRMLPGKDQPDLVQLDGSWSLTGHTSGL